MKFVFGGLSAAIVATGIFLKSVLFLTAAAATETFVDLCCSIGFGFDYSNGFDFT
jgi:hypothetical protein